MTQAWVVEIEVGSVARPSESLPVCSMSLQVDAADPLQAAGRALDLLRPGGPVTRLQVLTVADAERELVSPRLPDLVGVLDVQELAGLRTKQRALQVTQLPHFPPPALVTRAGRLWVRSAVESFLSRWPRRTGRPPRT